MKRTLSILLAVLIASASLAQVKPDKTHDHTTFGKRVYGNFSAGMDPTIFLPDNKALEFISSKTGRSIEELKAEKERFKDFITEGKHALLTANAGGKTVTSVEVQKLDHPNLTMANLIIVAGPNRIELSNCIQTDRTWVLGDYFGFEGKRPERVKLESKEEVVAKYLAMNEKDYSFVDFGEWSVNYVIKVDSENPNGIMKGGRQLSVANFYHLMNLRLEANGDVSAHLFKGDNQVKWWSNFYEINKAENKLVFLKADKTFEDQLEIKCITKGQMILLGEFENAKYYFIATKSVYAEESKPVAVNAEKSIVSKEKYSVKVPAKGPSGQSPLINPSLFDKPMRGFYIDKQGNKVDAVIKYQAPENMNNGTSALLLYKIAHDERGFTEDESTNFTTAMPKSMVQAFYVNGYIYVPITGNQWGILITEGAIRESVFFERKMVSGNLATLEANFLHKRDGSAVGITAMLLTFRRDMSKFIADFPELSAKVSKGEDGYKYLSYPKVVQEYNKWFDENSSATNIQYFFSDLSLSAKESKPASTVQVETSFEAPDMGNTELPEHFSKLVGKWVFSKVLQNDRDVSEHIKWAKINGQPIVLIYEKDGRIVYPSEAESVLKIKEGKWQYMPNETRDLKITTVMVDGNAEETFKIVSVTDKEFIYEDTRARAKYYFVR